MARMSNAPVYYALIQAKFNPIAAMEKYVGEIQDVLRHLEFTLFETQETKQLEFAISNEGTPPEPRLMTTTAWIISKADRKSGFILNSSSLTFHTTEYDTHDEFIKELVKGLAEVHKVLGLEHISRIGLRYLSAVIPQKDQSVDMYLDPGVRGVNLKQTRQYSLYESIYKTSCQGVANTTLVARVHRAIAPLGYPPDMNPSGLVSKDKFSISEVIDHAVIDIDHFSEATKHIDLSKIGSEFLTLHITLREAFDAISTDDAKKIWNS